MVRAFYCKELAGFTIEELHKYFADADQFAPNKKRAGTNYVWSCMA